MAKRFDDQFQGFLAGHDHDIALEEEWVNSEFKAEKGDQDEKPPPESSGTYALTDRRSDPHAQQRGNDR